MRWRGQAFGMRAHLHGDAHAVLVRSVALIRAVQRDGLPGVAGDADADEVAIADDAVGRIELHPTGAWQIDLAPRMRRTAAENFAGVALGDVDVAGDEARRKTQGPRRLDHQGREVAARAAPERQG